MKKTPLSFASSASAPGDAIPLAQLESYADCWLLDCDSRYLSRATITTRRLIVDKLLWFLHDRELPVCGKPELLRFFGYLRNGHDEAGGRWGNPPMARTVRPGTLASYFAILRTLFKFLVAEGALAVSPIETMTKPIVRADQVQPFSDDQLAALRAAARRSLHPRRDEAILLLLLDTGLRASELCALRVKDVDLQGRRATALGKGNKARSVYFGRDTSRALFQYLKQEQAGMGEDGPLFTSDRGQGAGEALTRSGLLQLIGRLGKAAKIEATRCSPHTFRHTFAVSFLRAGGNVFSLKELLGHTSLTICQRYVALAQADIERQHRAYSPVDRLKGARK